MTQKEVLKAFFENAFYRQGWPMDDKALSLLHQAINLSERPPDESESYRTAYVRQESDGKVTAHSIKLYNISQVGLTDLFGLLYKEMGLILFEETVQKVLYGLGVLLIDFLPKLKYEFNEQDAKLLLCLVKLNKKQFTKPELAAQYKTSFKKNLAQDKLDASITLFKDLRVIKSVAQGEYKIEEKIKNLTRE
ncbi:MAG TPA: hypothetical protein PKE06_26975 [Flavilitoribacter sp.]|nr:hypothetical protein [Flavilitoribacter sp.]HMQ91399.1 hypothetical protein [Flavilitoribacter sp.]